MRGGEERRSRDNQGIQMITLNIKIHDTSQIFQQRIVEVRDQKPKISCEATIKIFHIKPRERTNQFNSTIIICNCNNFN